MIIADSKKLIFIHIYKTGGSSITKLLLPYITEGFRSKRTKIAGGGWQNTWHFDRNQHSKFSDVLPRLEKSGINTDEYFKFVFVRNPYSWILSIWNNFYQSPKRNLPDSMQNSIKFMLRGIFNKKMDSQYFFEMYPNGGFKNFLLFVDEIVSNNPQMINKVWGATDQYSFIENERMIDFNYIGRFENLQEDLNKISKLSGATKLSQMPPKSINNSKQDRRDYLSYYDESSIKIVNKIFSRDFQKFNYQPLDV